MKQRNVGIRAVALACAVLLSLSAALSASAADGKAPEAPRAPLTLLQKQEDLEFLCANLKKLHPDIEANISAEEFEKAKNEIAAGLPATHDVEFALALQTLVARVGDSHTSANIGPLGSQMKVLPFVIRDYGGEWVLSSLEEKNARFLGSVLTALNGHPIDEVEKLLDAFVSHDNAVKARRQFPYNVYILEVLQFFGIAQGDGPVSLSVRTPEGGHESFEVAPILPTAQKMDLVKLADQREAVPKTAPDSSKNYWFTVLNPKTLYIQYNVCQQDKDLPMEQFVKQIDDKLKLGYYSKVLVDLRNNGGGSDGVLVPLIFKLQQRQKEQGFHIYTLIGESTYSSALTNAVELDVLTDTTLVGTPTSGSVNHFGSANKFVLPHSSIQVRYSTKYIDLDAFMPEEPLFNRKPEKVYGERPLTPEMPVYQTLEDELAGRDTAVEAILRLKV